MDFQIFFFLWSLSSSIIQCKRVERNHILHWVTSQPSELNELKLTVLWGQCHCKYNCNHWLGTSLSIYWLCFKSLSGRWSASLSTNNDSAKTTFPFLERHLRTPHTSYILTCKSIRISHYFLFRYSLIFFYGCWFEFLSASVIVPSK